MHSVSIAGPYDSTGVSNTPSRQKIFTCQPEALAEQDACAREIIGGLARRAFRRPVNDEDIRAVYAHYQNASATGGFETGIETALRALLVSPEFIFRIEKEPENATADSVYSVSDIDLASPSVVFLVEQYSG